MAISSQQVNLSDEELVGRIRRRERSAQDRESATDACEALYARYARRLLSYLAARANPNEVEDLHQAVWSKVWEKPPDRFYGGQFSAWIFRVAHNLAVDQIRRSRPERLDEHEPVASGRFSPPERLIGKEQIGILEESLAKLDGATVAVLRARLAGEDYDSISRRMGMLKDDAYQRVYQAKKELRHMMEKVVE
jgi:RNA polymerase sigma factor (sigma-70 family)